MKHMSLIILVLFCGVCSGCRMVAKLVYGFKDPEFETSTSLYKFQNEAGLDSIQYIGATYETWKNKKVLPAPEVFVFNKQGQYISYKDTLRPNCNGPAEVFLSELRPDKNYFISNEFQLNEFITMFEGPDCSQISGIVNDNEDYYVFMTYAVFTGKKLIREKNLHWLEALKNNQHINYKLILINEDLKACWTEEQKKWFEARDK